MNELVERLTTGEHPVEIVTRPNRSVARFKECMDRGVVHILFTDTRGGTELSVRLDPKSTADTNHLETGEGTVRIVGSLTLNFEKVQCIADIDLKTLEGKGHLVAL